MRRNSSQMVEELLHYFCCFECNSLFAIGCVKGCSKHVRVWSPRPSIAVSPLADFTPSPNTQTKSRSWDTFLSTFSGQNFLQLNLPPHFRDQQTGLPPPLGAGSARPNQKKGAPDTKNPSCIGFTVLGGGLRPWSQTMVSKGARPWGRCRSVFAKEKFFFIAGVWTSPFTMRIGRLAKGQVKKTRFFFFCWFLEGHWLRNLWRP